LTSLRRPLRALTDFVLQKKYRKMDVFLVSVGLLAVFFAHVVNNPELNYLVGADLTNEVATKVVAAHLETKDCASSLAALLPVEVSSERRVDDQFIGIFKVRAQFHFVEVPMQPGIPLEYIQSAIACNVQMLQMHENIGVSMGDTVEFYLLVEMWKMGKGHWKVLSIEEV
jgi:hypothetical protein